MTILDVEIINAIGKHLVEFASIVSTFVLGGGLAAIVKYRNDRLSMSHRFRRLKKRQLALEKMLDEMKEYTCYRENCAKRLRQNRTQENNHQK